MDQEPPSLEPRSNNEHHGSHRPNPRYPHQNHQQQRYQQPPRPNTGSNPNQRLRNERPSNPRAQGRSRYRNRFMPKMNSDNNNHNDTSNHIDNHQEKSAEGPKPAQPKANNVECMICCDNVHRSNHIWYCSNCYNIFHLTCAMEWCNKSIKSRNEAIANAQYPSLGQAPSSQSNQISNLDANHQGGYSNYRNERTTSIEWPCPACRIVLYTKPNKYKCFCGKVIRPEINRHLPAHSCGQLCGRKRPDTNCPHTCNSICHPGRCEPCQLTSRRSCFCGKLTQEIKCSSITTSCGQVCGKTLSCGQHFCNKICHDGSCISCDEILILVCYCGQQEVRKRCADFHRAGTKNTKEFSCNKTCGKLLDCGKHPCNEPCHPGPKCPSCKLLSQNIKTCPCGSTLIKKSLLTARQSCTDPVPTCDNKCGKTLICGPEKNRHKCQKKCHIGSCPPCKLKTTAHCECKLSTRTIDCSLMFQKHQLDDDKIYFNQVKYTFTCEARCNRLKNCTRHRCHNKCCSFLKTLDNSVHACDQLCNKKLPCGLHSCQEPCHPGQCGDCANIGWEELTCHCGASVLYPPIPCGAKPPACHRPCRRAHNCGHPVKHECHDDTEKCAPCTVFVKKSCFCGADSKDSVYCYLPGYSCGRTCKKQLSCGQHTCQRVCHDNECETPDARGVILCTQSCPVTRYSCKHTCGQLCHGKTPCPVSECKKIIELTCECGNKTERTECHKIMRDVDSRNMMAMLNLGRSNQGSEVIVDLSVAPASSKQENRNNSFKKLECDESCSILMRNKALAEALDIAQPDLKPVNIFGEDPLRLLKEAIAQDYKFVAATYDSLVRFIEKAKESDKRFIFMQFPPASKLRREVEHELAHHFHCTSETRGDDPFQHVVVRAYKNKSCIPDFNIEQLLPVSDS